MSDKTTGTIILPTGEEELIATRVLDPDEAELLRNYKKFLLKYGLAEALRCKHCFEMLGPSSGGCEAHVTDNDILIRCRHEQKFYRGLSF